MTAFLRFFRVASAMLFVLTAYPVSGAIIPVTFTNSSSVPITEASYDATGKGLGLSLGFAPPVGTSLTVVRVTGLDFIQGSFDNLIHGQRLDLSYGGITYPFVVNYYGGSGNDLVLQWANNRVLAWGGNDSGQLGLGDTLQRNVPVAVTDTGVLAGKTILALAAGDVHSLALCADGTLATWGNNFRGQLGNNSNANSDLPVAVDRSGVLAGKEVVAIAAGRSFNLVLCRDGSLVTWGTNLNGELGDNTYNDSKVPVLVDRSGVLAGRKVISIAVGESHALALCLDGAIASWGSNSSGQLGVNNTNIYSSRVPMEVVKGSVLAGKTINAVSAGSYFSFALCSDSTLASWGGNETGQLGNNTTTNAQVPVAVTRTGVLAGKSIVSVKGGWQHGLALCSDSTLAAWGYNGDGQLGNNSTTQSRVPVLVSRTGVLSGKTITSASAGFIQGVVVCSDGTVASWGGNASGQLGNNSTTPARVPVLVNAGALRAGERRVAAAASATGLHNLALVASPPQALVSTLAATLVSDTGAVVQGDVNANGSAATIKFEYGLAPSYGFTATAAPSSASGAAATPVSAALSGLLPGKTYHYRVVAASAGGTSVGADMTFTTGTAATLAGLSSDGGRLLPAYDPAVFNYSLAVPNTVTGVTITPSVTQPGATVKIGGVAVVSGSASAAINLNGGNNPIPVAVTSADGAQTLTYTVTVSRLPDVFAFNSVSDVPLTVSGFDASGKTAAFSLGHAPLPGSVLKWIENTGFEPIQGEFDNLPQGRTVVMYHNGIAYSFVVDYFGGTGNDLVLRWANNRLFAWGNNSAGQLGIGTTTFSSIPVATAASGVLAGKTIVAESAGRGFSLALCSDGTLAAWGANGSGQLGNNAGGVSLVPVLVDTSGALAGKRVIAIATGASHSLALCSDGTVAAWGVNQFGQLGNNNGAWITTPVVVNATGALTGKKVIAISAGESHSLALCSDGTMAAWGRNEYGQLGNNSTGDSATPVAVVPEGVLSGKRVVAIASALDHNLALCLDGTLVSWGRNNAGQLGNNSTLNANAKTPIVVSMTGALAGKSVKAIKCGSFHSMVLCTDGSVAAWGDNNNKQLGDNSSNSYSLAPVAVNRAGVLNGKTPVAIAAGWGHGAVICSDGSMATYGNNDYGKLGNGTSTSSGLPVLVSTGSLRVGERFAPITHGQLDDHMLAVVASPPAPIANTLAAGNLLDNGATLTGEVSANGSTAGVSFEYGPTPAYGSTVAARQVTVSGTTATVVNVELTGLPAGSTWHYRVVAESAGGRVVGENRTFTTTTLATLSGLSLGAVPLSPGFAPATIRYSATVPFSSSAITVTPAVQHAGAAATVNGVPVASGSASAPIALAEGPNLVSVAVIAADGINRLTYTIQVTRLPETFRFTSAGTAGATVDNLIATGNTAAFELAFQPATGTSLTVVRNTGLNPIQGTFDNLAHGQKVDLIFGGIAYPFVANYYGGSGNDLVLQWANHRVFAWGNNNFGQLGLGTTTSSSIPAAILGSGVLANRVITALSTTSSSSVALCADGTLATWGSNSSGQLGIGSTTRSTSPVIVDASTALLNKLPVAVSAGGSHVLVVCADGTLAAWGGNNYGQLGNNATEAATRPVAVIQNGVLAGKRVVAVAAGDNHSLALCSDGSLAAWGDNQYGQLGNNSTTRSLVPVAVDMSGVLGGKQVAAIAVGQEHNLALCTDGTLVTWGAGGNGRLGNNSTINSPVPVVVDTSGVLSGKTVTAISGGGAHNLVLCSDGTLASWGNNSSGILGSGVSSSNSLVPVAVSRAGILSGRTVVAIEAADSHSLVVCSDGSAAVWGSNSYGQLGSVSTNSSNVPVLVNSTNLTVGERFVDPADGFGFSFSLGLVASPPPPFGMTLAASGIKDHGATLRATVMPGGGSTTVSFEYGTTTSYGTTVAAVPPVVSGVGATSVSREISGLLPGITYHYRVVVTNGGGTRTGDDVSFTTSTLATLEGLSPQPGELTPSFDRTLTGYRFTVPFATDSVTLTPVASQPSATVKVNGTGVVSGSASAPIPLAQGANTVTVLVDAGDGINSRNYQVVVTRLPERFSFPASGTIPVTVSGFTASGNAPDFLLGYVPAVGESLVVVRNTGTAPIEGEFANLAQGQVVVMEFGGISYPFVANYSGGDGNDLVMEWANRRLLAWGNNSSGQLGNGSQTNALVPSPVTRSGILAGKPVSALATNGSRSLAVAIDGTLAIWGESISQVPVSIVLTGDLAGRRVVQVASSTYARYGLCSDGTLLRFGTGSGDTTPVIVPPAGALIGRRIVAISAGNYHALALCADGGVVAWGTTAQFTNTDGQLGNNSTESSVDPVNVFSGGVLAGKTVKAIAAGGNHNLALCTDGTLVSWGGGNSGQLGIGSSPSYQTVPVVVVSTGVLSGKSVVAVAAGTGFSLVLCSDGTLAAWGANYNGQLGNSSSNDSNVPVLVSRTGVLAGKTVTAIRCGNSHSLAFCSDGSMAGWGGNSSGQLGDDSNTERRVPVLVNNGGLRAGERVLGIHTGPLSSFNIAIVASPPPPAVTTLAASGIVDTTATLNAAIEANGSQTQVHFEYGLNTHYGRIASAAQSPLGGSGVAPASAALTGLLPGTTYHFRVVASNGSDTSVGSDMTLVTSAQATLASLVPGEGSLIPGFSSLTNEYALTVPASTASITLTAAVAHAGATLRINGAAVGSGVASAPVPLADGNTAIPVEVTSADGLSNRSHMVTVTRVPDGITFPSASGGALTTTGFDASGLQPVLALGFAPAVGTDLKVVNNSGSASIRGAFGNLPQGAPVALPYNGIIYQFVANYFGGDGNDLVLQWANTRLTSWGRNDSGQLGDRSQTDRYSPVAVYSSGVLAGKTVIATACSSNHSLALCSDGTLAAWGSNYDGQLGDGTTNLRLVPVEVDRSGDLAGKTIAALAAGSSHSLALCSDGTLVAWGSNSSSQLGNIGMPRSLVPVVIGDRGVLTGKEVVTIAAGSIHNLALCADGTLAAWGGNNNGQLGDGTTSNRLLPVIVGAGGLLDGRKVVAIAAAQNHNLAACDDGTMFAWGVNTNGQLGDQSTVSRLSPVGVNPVGALAGKKPVALAAGYNHSIALCADGSLAAWGYNGGGELGNNTTTNSLIPVAVTTGGVLLGKPIVRIDGAGQHNLAQCADGTLATWGYNSYGRLGTGNTGMSSSPVPVLVDSAGLAAGERFVGGRTGPLAAHGLGLVASPPLPVAATLAANPVGDTDAALNATVQASGAVTAVSFEYGPTAAYGNTATASPPTVTGTEITAVNAPVAGLLPGTTYHFRVKAANPGGTVYGEDLTFTTGNSAGLADLVLSTGSLTPAFDGKIRDYLATVPFTTTSLSVTAAPVVAGAAVKVNNQATGANGTSGLIDLVVGSNTITVEVVSAVGGVTQDFSIVITRLPERIVYQSSGDVPVTAGGFAAGGMAPAFALGFKPSPGTRLTVVNNTGNGMIAGFFDNLAQGQLVEMDFEGVVYQFVASYSGGSGNDLVLDWANRRLFSWGYGSSGQLGVDGTETIPLPGEIAAAGALAGRVILATSSGTGHTLALCADGGIAAWGYNLNGQLGDGSLVDRLVPVAVDASGVLAGRRVVRLAAGGSHSLALCADGALATWGNNNAGQLGLPANVANSSVPVLVEFVGALAGKSVVSIGAGDNFSFAVCSDGTVVSWGANGSGQLGNNSNSGGPMPVAVEHRGVLAGKSVVAVAGGYAHAIALCSDGTLATWGRHDNGELGIGVGSSSSVPVLVSMSGVLAGKTVTEISSGVYHCLVLCSDGTLASWGYNGASQLGDNTYARSNVPVLVYPSGVLLGRKPVAISAGAIHNVVVCEDGFVAAWGTSPGGSLGDGVTTSSIVPVAVSTAALRAGERFAAISSGSGFNIGLVVAPPQTRAATLAAADITDHGATLQGEIGANGSETRVYFEFGQTESYGSTIAATPSPLNGISVAPVGAATGGLLSGTLYHYRVVASGPGGVVRGGDMTFTTTRRAALAGIGLSAGYLSPAFDETRNDYSVTLPAGIESITVTPAALNPGSVVRVNGVPVASGSASRPIALVEGDTLVNLAVDAGDGVNTNIYQITVSRLPAVFGFGSSTQIPVTTGRFDAGGLTAAFELRYHPEPGVTLTVVKQTGPDPIGGTFRNLAQGELVLLPHEGMIYQFVADYSGGTGNDLVLRWANTRPLGWGSNAYGQLGTGVSATSLMPVALKRDGALAGRSLMEVAAGARVGMGLCSDGTLAIWGDEKPVPVSVSESGVLAGRRVVAIAAGELHYLALCSDGTVAAWGWNGYGQLGDNSMTDSPVPVAVDQSGVLAGKRVIALAAGYGHSLALCSDGTIAAWGVNSHGQLGNQRTNHSPVPVLVSTSGVLSGKRVAAIAAGQNHNLALCSDGTLVSWGNNENGRLGDNSSTHRFAPVAVDASGVLAGKSVTGISAGFAHSMVLTSDGKVACWGSNSNGRLGDGGSTDRLVPVVANTAGVLAGKTIIAAQAGKHHSMALCSDGTLASWGSNGNGELGNNTTNSSSNPVIVNATALAVGEKLISIRSGQGAVFNLAMVASPPQAVAITLAATLVGEVTATLNGRVHPNGNAVSLSFEYGTGPGYGNRIDAVPAAASGTGATDVSVALTGLQPGETYHYRIVARSSAGVVAGEDMTFTLGAGAALADLKIQPGVISPAFVMSGLEYSATVASSTSNITVTAVTAVAGAGLKVHGSPAVSGSASGEIPLSTGENAIAIDVTSPAGSETARYNLVVTRLPAVMHFGSAADVPLSAARLHASGNDVAFSLGFAPEPGTRLLAIRNSGAEPIQGTFNGLPQGGTVILGYGGKSYSFVANYFGGTGNDLVFEWAATRVLAWGANEGGQLGNGTLLQSPTPLAVRTDGVLAGRTVISLANGEYHTLALCADGTLAAWGANGSGQLGDGSTASSAVPVKVTESGVLAGRTVVAIAAGSTHSLALCADGTLAAWGYNIQGQLGNGGKLPSRVPVAVKTAGVLANRKVQSIAASDENSYVICTDGTVAAWGRNHNGQLGNGGFISSNVPVQVDHLGALAGKSVTSIAAGQSHVIALCSDGTLVGWGYNGYGNLGNNSTGNSPVPVAVDQAGVLAGKAVVAVAAGQNHSVAALSDGTAAAWGYNGYRQLGNGASDNSIRVPVSVNASGVLAGKFVIAVAAGANHCLALCSDGTLAAWGRNSAGQLGNGSSSNSDLPVEVSRAALIAGERATAIVCGGESSSGFVLVASPHRATVTTLAATQIGDTMATLTGAVNPDALEASLFFDYGPTPALGESIAAQPASASGSASVSATGAISGLVPGSSYHFRLRAVNSLGTVFGETMTFTTGTAATLASLAVDGGGLLPSFASGNPSYSMTLPSGVESVVLRPVASDETSTIRVNGTVVASGASSDPVPVAAGNNAITVSVTSADGSQSFEYFIAVTRLPGLFEYASARDVPVTVANFTAAGQVAALKLGFAPLPGTELLVVNNTGSNPIQGELSNIPNGGIVALDFNGITYHFFANYFGGDGNDMVLRWANTRLMGWGYNTDGQLGNGLTTNSAVLTPAGLGGAMSGKRIMSMATGGGHTLALCTDGSLIAWGANDNGQLGNGGTTDSLVPVAVDQTGVLAGRTVVSMASGRNISYAICSDGTLAGWGYNGNGLLGDDAGNRSRPVEVPMVGALAGRRVIAIAAGEFHALALCSDGTLAAWGFNGSGRLGNGNTLNSMLPVAVDRSGVLRGKTVGSIAVGSGHNLALCTDGTVVAWGENNNGQLGNGGTVASAVPVAVDISGLPAGVSVSSIAAGWLHSLALCSDGTAVSWGYNNSGQLGDGTTVSRSKPVSVNRNGVLSSRKIGSLIGGGSQSLAFCEDGTVAAWGHNGGGQLGNNSLANSPVPVDVTLVPLRPQERIVGVVSGAPGGSALAQVASPLQSAVSLAATGITGTSASLRADVNPAWSDVSISFEYGLDQSYGMTQTATPMQASGSKNVSVSAGIGGLLPGTIYHFRVVVTGVGGVVRGGDLTFTTLSDNAHLAGLRLSSGTLAPSFDRNGTHYVATVRFNTSAISLVPTTEHPGARVLVNGVLVASGAPSKMISLDVGNTTITKLVTAEDGITTKSYTVTLTRLPQEFVFRSASDVPVVADGFNATGIPANLVLAYPPLPGTILTVVRNTSLGFIHGNFPNLSHGSRVTLNHGGRTYDFVANYYGGSGNDLVLQWADTRVMAWGSNTYGQVGDASTTQRLIPTAVNDASVLAGKTVVAVSGGYLHSLALCSDGSLAAWGYNSHGQLGNDSTLASPVPVIPSGVLTGRTVIAISAGPFHNLALCSDGTVAAWGNNNYGQLGNGNTLTSRVPVLVNPVGALAGKQVVGVAAGSYHSFALCADGSVAAWGYNDEGELGDGTTQGTFVPVPVNMTGTLAGKRIASLAAGQYHTLALCTDGTLAAWGYNNRGQLGNQSTLASVLPVETGSFGALVGRSVVAVAAGGSHSLALCSDGTLAAWGWNHRSQLGTAGVSQSDVPVVVGLTGDLNNRAIDGIAVGVNHNLLRLDDGEIAMWGDNSNGQLGDDSIVTRWLAGVVDTTAMASGSRFMFAGSGSAANHSLAVVGLPTEGSSSLLEAWREEYFGNAASAGQGADCDDCDQDGIPNLVEYAFGLNPLENSAGQLPQARLTEGNLVLRFTRPAGVAGIVFGAEWSSTLLPGDWNEVPDTGSGDECLFSVPAGASPKTFLRMKISSP